MSDPGAKRPLQYSPPNDLDPYPSNDAHCPRAFNDLYFSGERPEATLFDNSHATKNLYGKKFDEGKIPLHLLPPDALYEIAQVLQLGADKYGAWNWSKGVAAGRLVRAALGHIWDWWAGEDLDPETNLSHLAHAGCCILFLLSLRRNKPAGWQDDRPKGLVSIFPR